MGVKFVSRSPSPLVPECDFRVTQEVSMSVCSILFFSVCVLLFFLVVLV